MLLQVQGLCVHFADARGETTAVRELSFELDAGQSLGLVGESGSGKSQTALALTGLLPEGARASGSVRFEGRQLLGLPRAQWNRIRGNRLGLVFQDPMTSLNPHLRVGLQMAEVLEQHRGMARGAALAEAQRLLDAVRVSDPARRLQQYPHELSGGMRQRVMIAMSLLTQPRLLIADEPTTALDVTVQAQILRLLAQLRQDFGLAILLITHDLGVVAELCERTLVLYAGRLMEYGATRELLVQPTHPYTAALLRSRPRIGGTLGKPLPSIPGQSPDPRSRLPGCAFAPRCAHAAAECTRAEPPLESWKDAAQRRCHLPPTQRL